jgi:hypothetical protein
MGNERSPEFQINVMPHSVTFSLLQNAQPELAPD